MSIGDTDHRNLALWAADCAEHVLALFEDRVPGDHRPREAVEAARAWARGEIRVGRAREVALDAHAAARETVDPAARSAARAAAHAAATAHMVGHARHAATYAAAAAAATASERAWQSRLLPERLWPVAFPADGATW